jgi:hypothetical protein
LAEVTITVPEDVPAATVAVICVALTTVKPDTSVPPMRTLAVPVKFVPERVTNVPTEPDAGEKEATVGLPGLFWSLLIDEEMVAVVALEVTCQA